MCVSVFFEVIIFLFDLEMSQFGVISLLFVESRLDHVEQYGEDFVVGVSNVDKAFSHEEGVVPANGMLLSQAVLVLLDQVLELRGEEESVYEKVSCGGVVGLGYFIGP